jgi:hypothetical protein
MKAYIDTHYEGGRGFYCDVVSEQDYHEGGPLARSHRTEMRDAASTAEHEAKQWAQRHGYTVASVDEVAA